jgi:sporulation protein YlmC with PRC-barrel domain
MSPGSGSISGTGLMRGEGSPYQLRASDLLGMDVINSSGEDIGEIDDLTVGEDGSIEAVLALGGVLGMGEKMVTIGYDNMQFDEEREHLIVNITEEELENMDEFQYMEGEQRGREITPGMY